MKPYIYLDALAREKHFRRAAEACNVSQPALSTAVAQLEAELGVPIVKRGRQFIGFTEEGEVVLAHARRILAEQQAMLEGVAEARQGLRGTLRIGAIPAALPLIAHITAPFSKRYPAVRLTILSLTSQDIQRRLENFEIDIGVTYLDNEPLAHVKPKPIFHESYGVLLRADAPAAKRKSMTWSQAAQLKLCLLTPDMQNRRIIDGVFRSVGVAPTPAIETNSIFNLCTHAAIPGVASIVSRQLIEFFGLQTGVVWRPLLEPVVTRTLGLIVADREPTPPLARALIALTRFIDETRLGRDPLAKP
ncbi:MAG: LysR family transcriptional regulator [Hyphomicrobiales bacterium]|nr:LysR family transcriptional regulator [Hyphomicrobiales bacterium]